MSNTHMPHYIVFFDDYPNQEEFRIKVLFSGFHDNLAQGEI